LWSKRAVFDWLTNSATPEYSLIDGFMRFILAENVGAAFSMLAGMKWVFISISAIALVVIQTLFLKGKLTPRLMLAALACVNAGIIGNLYDRIFTKAAFVISSMCMSATIIGRPSTSPTRCSASVSASS
jgi:lipoprotein signal peptidase